MVSHWFAWISFGLSIILLAKFIVRKSKVKGLNRIFSKTHKPLSCIMIVLGLAHGIIDAIKTDKHIAVIISGAVLSAVSIFLLITWLCRKKLKIWMKAHRIASLVFLGLLVVHIVLVHI